MGIHDDFRSTPGAAGALRNRSRARCIRRGLCGLLVSGVIATAFAAVPPAEATAAAETLEIAVDTVWEGTIEISGEVKVLKGAILLIQPGSTLRFAATKNEKGAPRARLFIEGTVIAQGTKEEPILFTSAAAEPEAGDWGGIVLEHSKERANRLQHARIEFATAGVQGSYAALLAEDIVLSRNLAGVAALLDFHGGISRARIVENTTGLHYSQNSSFKADGCEIVGNAGSGVSLLLNSSPTIRGCKVADNKGGGIVCVQGSSPLIEGNIISGNERGISMELQSRPLIRRNLITGNETGIWGEKLVFPLIEHNSITGNGTGIYCNFSAYPEIHENNISGNGTFGLVLGDNMSIIMQKKIPYRRMGTFSFERPPGGDEMLPEQSRKYQPFAASDEGIVDARGNWWGPEVAAEMERIGESGNVSVIEDWHDKPDTWYGDETYRRDRVAFAPWAKEPIPDAVPPADSYSGVAGKVVAEGRPVAGVRVHAYLDAEGAFNGEGVSYSAPSSKDGSFGLRLAEGSYFLVAKAPLPPFPGAEPGAEEYYGYYGGNPVAVSRGDELEVTVNVAPRESPRVSRSEKPSSTRIEGTVVGPEGPVEGAAIHVYPDASRQFRGPDLFGPQGAMPGGTDGEGKFATDLPPGRYFLVATKRQGGQMLGPLQPGDLYGYFGGNPLTLEGGTRTAITIRMAKKLRETSASAESAVGATGIRGSVRTPDGKVPAGVFAYATTDPSFMIGAMPLHRSQPLEPDGSFFIRLPAGAKYYVSARSGYGGPPLPGEWHGFYGEETPRAIAVEAGHVAEGIDFVVRMME